MQQLLTLGFIAAPGTIFNEVRKLRPGHPAVEPLYTADSVAPAQAAGPKVYFEVSNTGKEPHEFEILGASHGDITVRELISAQMDGIYFPITIKEFGAPEARHAG